MKRRNHATIVAALATSVAAVGAVSQERTSLWAYTDAAAAVVGIILAAFAVLGLLTPTARRYPLMHRLAFASIIASGASILLGQALGLPVLSGPCVPLGILGAILSMVGIFQIRGSGPGWTLRCAVDTLAAGLALVTLVWRLFLVKPSGGLYTPVEWYTLVYLSVMCCLVVCVTVFSSDRRRTGPTIAIGASCLIAVQLIAIRGGGTCLAVGLTQLVTIVGLATAVLAVRWIPKELSGVFAVESNDSARRDVISFGILMPLLLTTVWSVLPGHTLDEGALLLVVPSIVFAALRSYLLGRFHRDSLRTLQTQAMEDPLTGLRNRRCLLADLSESGRLYVQTSVIILNLDRFKTVNISLGVDGGDDVLRQMARNVAALCGRYGARAFRLGGDEFIVVVPAFLDRAVLVADELRACVATTFSDLDLSDRVLGSASAGVAQMLLPDQLPDGEMFDPLNVLTAAAEALRVAKVDRDRTQVFTEELRAQVLRQTLIEAKLQAAIAGGRIEMHFQPVIDLRSGRVRALEALARWHDPELGHVSPEHFVPVAEQTGMIHQLGHLAIVQSLNTAVRCRDAGFPIYVAVNVSPVQLRHPDFLESLVATVELCGTTADALMIEVTEAVFMDPDDPAVAMLDRVARVGFRIAIDDFGSGYSSLGYMSRLPSRVLKIDRSLTTQVLDAKTRHVLRAILDMSQALDLDVIAEGVETTEVADAIRHAGAGYGQGWLWSKAVAPADVLATLDLLTRNAPALVAARSARV